MELKRILERMGNRTVAGLPGWEVEEQFPYRLEYREGGRVLQLQAGLVQCQHRVAHQQHQRRSQPAHLVHHGEGQGAHVCVPDVVGREGSAVRRAREHGRRRLTDEVWRGRDVGNRRRGRSRRH